MARTTGTVKWFSQEKGYGFIQQEGGPDVFVHHQAIEGTGFKMLYEGERVEFDVIQEPKGLKAQNVTRLDPPAQGGGETGGRAGRGFGGGSGGGGGGGRGFGDGGGGGNRY
jgi:CspA family cold shock protein